jgi:hypothetical protein
VAGVVAPVRTSNSHRLSMTILAHRAALLRLCDTSTWHLVVGLTLNLKQSIRTPNGGFVMVDELAAKKAFKTYMDALDRRIYRSAYRHHDKRLSVIPILEKSAGERWHYHLAIEPPVFMIGNQFTDLASQLWLNSELGYGHGHADPDVDQGWMTYITKLRTKNAFEHYLDSLDIDSLHNPAASG